MSEAPKLRRLRFGLRTLFVTVALIACWFAYESSWLTQRDNFLAVCAQQRLAIEQKHKFRAVSRMDMLPDPNPLHLRVVLWTFQREAVNTIQLCFDHDSPEREQWIARAHELFPEAEIEVDDIVSRL